MDKYIREVESNSETAQLQLTIVHAGDLWGAVSFQVSPGHRSARALVVIPIGVLGEISKNARALR